MGTVEDQAAAWGVPVGRVNQINQWADQWEQLTGYTVTLSQGQLQNMAQNTAGTVGSLSDMANYIWVRQSWIPQNVRDTMPWAGLGIDRDQYQARLSSLSSVYQRLTGKAPDLSNMGGSVVGGGADFGKGGVNGGMSSSDMLFRALAGDVSAGDLEQQLTQDSQMQKTYGWLKFGLNYDQFQRQKADYRTSFGADLTDEQAINQLKYDHALGHVLGAYQTAQLQPESAAQQQQQPPTPAAGLTSSTVR